MIPDIQSIIAMLLAGECTSEQAEAWIYTHMENSDLRDQFAGMAMQGMLVDLTKAFYGIDWQTRLTESSYDIADAMLKARQS